METLYENKPPVGLKSKQPAYEISYKNPASTKV